MAVREKLNTAYFLGSLALATVAGTLTGSWVVWLVALALLIGVSVHGRGIRVGRRRR